MSEIKIKCPRCRGTQFKTPSDDPWPKDRLTCTRCGFSNTYERIVGDDATQAVMDQLSKAFKGFR